MNALLTARRYARPPRRWREQVQTESSAELDPWWMYWQGQYRMHPAAMARVRELSK